MGNIVSRLRILKYARVARPESSPIARSAFDKRVVISESISKGGVLEGGDSV